MRLHKVVTVDKPVARVFAYLSDFTTSNEWDPGTVTTVRVSGDGGVGTTYLNTSKFAGRETQLTYVMTERVPNERFALRGENKTVISEDTLTFRSLNAGARTEVTYVANFTFKGLARFVAPLFKPAMTKLGDEAEVGLQRALGQL